MTSFATTIRRVTRQGILARVCQLRTAIDWQTILYRHVIPANRFDELAERGGTIEIGGVPVCFQPRLQGRGLVLQAEGWYVHLADPRVNWDDVEKATGIPVHGCEIQAQGRFWSGGSFFLPALRSLEDWLGLHNICEIDGRGIRVPLEDEDRIPGRLDIACDLWLQKGDYGNLTPEDIYDALIAAGDHKKVKGVWVTKAKRAQIAETPRTETSLKAGNFGPLRTVSDGSNLTLYMGAKTGIELCIYRKDADYKGNAKDALLPVWRRKGYDGTGIVCRIEFRISREKIRLSEFKLRDRIVKGRDINLGQLYECLDSQWGRCLELYRHAPGSGRGDRRETSPIWRLLEQSPPTLECEQRPADIYQERRAFNVAELRKRTWHDMVNIQEALGHEETHKLLEWVESGNPIVEEYRTQTAWRGQRQPDERVSHERRDESGQGTETGGGAGGAETESQARPAGGRENEEDGKDRDAGHGNSQRPIGDSGHVQSDGARSPARSGAPGVQSEISFETLGSGENGRQPAVPPGTAAHAGWSASGK